MPADLRKSNQSRRVFTVVCPGAGRFEDDQRKAMPKDDKRLHAGFGRYSDIFPVNCEKCADPMQPRGMHVEIPIGIGA